MSSTSADDRLRVAVIGFGYWGPHLARNFVDSAGARLQLIADHNQRRRAAARALYPQVDTAMDMTEVLASSVKAVAIATPMTSHYELARKALEAGLHVLVEKPLAATSTQCEELVELARAQRLTLMVDHTFLYTSAVQKIREYVEDGTLGSILYFDSVRVNLGRFRRDSNVLWDLAPHDISIFNYVIGKQPRWVSATGATHHGAEENLVHVCLGCDDRLIAHFHLNWLAPVKVRRITIGGTRRMLVYDDAEPREKIKLYDHEVTTSTLDRGRGRELDVQCRTGACVAPELDGTEPLQRVVDAFVQASLTGTAPLSDGRAGADVVRLLETIQRSLRGSGARVLL
jgi:predicted dehydrogenase